MALGSDDFHQLIKQLEIVRNAFVDDKAAIIVMYPSVSPERDARITSYSKAINVLNSVQLSFTFISKHLLHNQWWEFVAREPISDADKGIYATEYAAFTKIGFVQGLFLAIESSLRLFLRALDPIACNGGTADFKSIYECLFRSKLSVIPSDGPLLLDLLRLVRNTIHNNGVYFDRRGIDSAVTWKGQVFEFRHGVPVDFVTWEYLLEVSEALRLLLRVVVEDVNLKAISTEITDPFFSRRY